MGLHAARIFRERLIVYLNFSDTDAEVWLPFPKSGVWVEQINGAHPAVAIAQNDQWAPVIVQSNYGGIYKHS